MPAASRQRRRAPSGGSPRSWRRTWSATRGCVERDEAGTLARLEALRDGGDRAAPGGAQGRLVKLMGDGVAGRVRQRGRRRRLRGRDPGGMAERRPTAERRICSGSAVNLGDVVVEGDDLYGDGVNIAARLEGSPSPAAIVVSGTAWDQLHGKLGLPFESLGEQRLKNIERPVRAYRLAASTGSSPPTAPAPAARDALDRGAAVRQSERRPRAGLFQRRDHRGPDHRAVALSRPGRDRPQLLLRFQGPGAGRGRDRAPAGRALPPRGQRAQGGRAGADHGPADRCRHRRPPLGRALRPRARRHLRGPGRGGRHHRRHARGRIQAAGVERAKRKPTHDLRRLRLRAAGAWSTSPATAPTPTRRRAACSSARSRSIPDYALAHAYLALAIFAEDWGDAAASQPAPASSRPRAVALDDADSRCHRDPGHDPAHRARVRARRTSIPSEPWRSTPTTRTPLPTGHTS